MARRVWQAMACQDSSRPLSRSFCILCCLCYNIAMQDEEIIQTIVSRIAETIHPQKIILFGSWARGERGPHSDIDILVIQESSQPRPQRYAQVRRLFWGMGLAMDILVYTPEEFARFQSVPGSFTHTVAHEGKVLYARPSG
jgi:predicted nucleotidyltransferase